MYDYTLSTLTQNIDTNFVISCWMPAFVAVMANLGFLTVAVGPDAVTAWLDNVTELEEFLVLVIVLVLVTMFALLLRALSFLIVSFFIGDSLPGAVAEWSTRGQQRNRDRALARLGDAADDTTVASLPDQVRRLAEQRYPRDAAALRPTSLGNMLAVATEYPWIVYEMAGMLWLPHLMPFLSDDLYDALNGAQSRLVGLLNLSLVSAVLACEGGLVLGVFDHHLAAAIAWAVVGVVLARFCYHAAVNQAVEVVAQIRVSFNLYRREILKQLGHHMPDGLSAERALWERLTEELLGRSQATSPRGPGRSAARHVSADHKTETAASASG